MYFRKILGFLWILTTALYITTSEASKTEVFINDLSPSSQQHSKNLLSDIETSSYITYNPNVISICSGYGVTDRMLLQGGFRILSSIDQDSKRTQVNTLNNVNVISNPHFRHNVITGDITNPTTLKTCISSVQSILKSNEQGNQNLNLIYAFIPWGKHVKTLEIIDSIFELVNCLEKENIPPQIICFEMNKAAQKKFNGIDLNSKFKDLLDTYKKKEEQVDISHYGVAATNQRHYKFWMKDTTKIFNLPSQVHQKTIKEYFEDFRSHYSDTIPEDWWDQPAPDGQNFPLHSFTYSLNNDEKKILEKWKAGMAIGELTCENNNDCLICSICQFKQVVSKERGGRNSSFQRTFINGFYPVSVVKNSYKWWLNPHPTQNRGYTIGEILALTGFSELQSFRFTEKDEIPASNFITFVTQPTSPYFLKQLFESFYETFTIKSNHIQLNLTGLPPLFHSGNLEYTASSMLKFTYELRKNPSAFFEQFKRENSIFVNDSKFLSTLIPIYPTNFQSLRKTKQEKFIRLMPHIKNYTDIFEFFVRFKDVSQDKLLFVKALETKLQPLTDYLLGYYPYISLNESQPYHCDLKKVFKNSKIQKMLSTHNLKLNEIKDELLNDPSKINDLSFEQLPSQISNASSSNIHKRKANVLQNRPKVLKVSKVHSVRIEDQKNLEEGLLVFNQDMEQEPSDEEYFTVLPNSNLLPSIHHLETKPLKILNSVSNLHYKDDVGPFSQVRITNISSDEEDNISSSSSSRHLPNHISPVQTHEEVIDLGLFDGPKSIGGIKNIRRGLEIKKYVMNHLSHLVDPSKEYVGIEVRRAARKNFSHLSESMFKNAYPVMRHYGTKQEKEECEKYFHTHEKIIK